MQICADIFSTLLERDGWGKRKGEESESKVDFVYLDICFCVYYIFVLHEHTDTHTHLMGCLLHILGPQVV